MHFFTSAIMLLDYYVAFSKIVKSLSISITKRNVWTQQAALSYIFIWKRYSFYFPKCVLNAPEIQSSLAGIKYMKKASVSFSHKSENNILFTSYLWASLSYDIHKIRYLVSLLQARLILTIAYCWKYEHILKKC